MHLNVTSRHNTFNQSQCFIFLSELGSRIDLDLKIKGRKLDDFRLKVSEVTSTPLPTNLFPLSAPFINSFWTNQASFNCQCCLNAHNFILFSLNTFLFNASKVTWWKTAEFCINISQVWIKQSESHASVRAESLVCGHILGLFPHALSVLYSCFGRFWALQILRGCQIILSSNLQQSLSKPGVGVILQC